MAATKDSREHPLANILINVLIPVLALSWLSKDPATQQMLGKAARPWHLGPVKALIIALALPLGYGIRHFLRTRKGNFFSVLGLVSVFLTGALTLYLWNPDGTVKPAAGPLFGLKEAAIPLALGAAVLFSQRTATPLLRVFLYNDTLFDIAAIERHVGERGHLDDYRSLLRRANRLFGGSFFLSAAINLGLSLFLFRSFQTQAPDALENYNAIVAKITGWSFVVVLAPVFAVLFLTLQRLVAGLRELTGLTDEQILLPR
ncbi:MAG TPA: VC0807 family protein [Rariglobus sp.]